MGVGGGGGGIIRERIGKKTKLKERKVGRKRKEEISAEQGENKQAKIIINTWIK